MISAKTRPTGIVLGSAELTLGALQALRALKLHWPRDISVVGYHDPPWFELAEGGITTVRLPVKDIAITATTVLLSRLENRQTSRSEEHTSELQSLMRIPYAVLCWT